MRMVVLGLKGKPPFPPYENGCPWDKESCQQASYGGHLVVLQYLRANGCPCDQLTYIYANTYKQIHILEYLYNNNV